MKLGEIVLVKTDGSPSRQREVQVKVLDFVETQGDTNYYWVEYPEGYLNLLSVDHSSGENLTDHDVGICEILNLDESEVEQKAIEYGLLLGSYIC